MTVVAHGISQSQDLPLPPDLVLQAGAATVVISFLGAALLWRRSRLGGGAERHPRARWWLPPLRIFVLALSLYLVGNAVFGPRTDNPVAHALFVWLWVGLVPVSVLFGPVWRAVNPLRTLHHLLHRANSGFGSAADPGPGSAADPDPGSGFGSGFGSGCGRRPLPAVGPWPAAVGLLAFVWLELIAPARTDPLLLGILLIGYGTVQLVLAAVYGERWFEQGDCFEVYSTLAARLSPLRWRPPLSGLAADRPVGAGRAAFLAVWWGSTVFDSATGSPWWAAFAQRTGQPLLVGTLALVLVCGVVLLAARRADVTNSLIPIAVAYTLAHYLTLLLVEGPRGALLVVHAAPAAWTVVPHPAVVSILQVALILVGHSLAVLAAHDAALAAVPSKPPLAVLADEFPVVLFMIACTWAGLFLLFT